ncbi:MAG: site-2 protease family protein [Thermoplasmatota archaeon]
MKTDKMDREEIAGLFRGPAVKTLFGQMFGPPVGTGTQDNMKRSKAAQLVEHIVSRSYMVMERRYDESGVYLKVRLDEENNGERFESVRVGLKELGLYPRLVKDSGSHFIVVVPMPRKKKSRTTVNIILLLSTIVTTVWAGSILWITRTGEITSVADIFLALFSPYDMLMGGLTFAFPLLLILGIHEMGHYFTSRRYGIDASLPYFIPIPPFISPIGTFGALISMKEPISNKKALIDIGAAGPIAGFIVAIPVTIIGLLLTKAYPVGVDLIEGDTLITINPPLLFSGLMRLLNVPGDGVLFPTAFAGWLGLFVTALNLLPVGQLDGGHIIRGALGDRSKYISLGVMGLMVALGILTGFATYIFFAILILILGARHPPPLDDISKLSTRQYMIAGLSVLIMGLTFHPLPLEPYVVEDQGVEIIGDWEEQWASPHAPNYHNIMIENPGTRDKTVTLSFLADGERLDPRVSRFELDVSGPGYENITDELHYLYSDGDWYIMLFGSNSFELREGEVYTLRLAYGSSLKVDTGNRTGITMVLETDKGKRTEKSFDLFRADFSMEFQGEITENEVDIRGSLWNLDGTEGKSCIRLTLHGPDLEPEVGIENLSGPWAIPMSVPVWSDRTMDNIACAAWGLEPLPGERADIVLHLAFGTPPSGEFGIEITAVGPGELSTNTTIMLSFNPG